MANPAGPDRPWCWDIAARPWSCCSARWTWGTFPRPDDGHSGVARLAAPISSITSANVATVADTGTGYQVQSVTGFRVWFEVDSVPRIPAGAAAAASGDGTVALDQRQDAEDFHQFMGHFMDILEALYEAPDATAPSRMLSASD